MSFLSYLAIFTSIHLFIGFLVEIVDWVIYLKQYAKAFISVRNDFITSGHIVTDANRTYLLTETDFYKQKVKARYLGWNLQSLKFWRDQGSVQYLDAKIQSVRERFINDLELPIVPKFSLSLALAIVALWPIGLIILTCEYSCKAIVCLFKMTEAWLTKISAYVWSRFIHKRD